MHFRLHSYILLAALIGVASKGVSQNQLGELTFTNESNFTPTIKDAAVKQTDQPEIIDTVKKLTNVTYSAPGIPFKTTYQTSQIEPAKMVNEPLSKLYQSLLKVGMGNYTMPFVDLFLNSLRNKDMTWGVRYNHLSSYAKFTGLGRTDFSDDNASLYAKKFYKKHTLSADFNYSRNSMHYYGFNDTIKNDNGTAYKQFFQTFEGKLRLQSHYGDTTNKINHDIRVNYYNYGDHYNTYENNIFGSALLNARVNKENFNVLASADYYSLHAKHDTINNIIVKLNPYFMAGGEKWKGDIGVEAVLDNFNTTGTKYYFYPRLNIYYDVYQSIIIPYAGIDGGLTKNSYRSLTTINPFMLSDLTYKGYSNTNNAISAFGGLRGALSSKLSYDVKALYGRYNNMAYFLADYNASTDNAFANRYKVIYMNTNYLNINAQVKYQFKEKLNIIAKGNYYGYKIIDTSNVKPWHKPAYDVTLSANYSLKSKIILKVDVFAIGSQWAQQQVNANNVTVLQATQLPGIVDMNLGAEYRYTKMLSFWSSFNNIGNYRYYRWDKYPTQRFNFMVGLSFTPF